MVVHSFTKTAFLLLALTGIGVGLAEPAAAQQGPMPVDVAAPLSARVVDWDEFTGRFEAVERVELRARVSGYLQRVNFRDGPLVKHGDVLFEIDPRPFEAALASAQADLSAAQAEQARADADLQRAETLADNAISQSARDQRRADKLRADAEVERAEAALRTATLELEYTKVTAATDGRISDRKVDIGNLVSAGESLLATVVSVDPIFFTFTGSEADFLKYSRRARRNGEGRPSGEAHSAKVFLRLQDEEEWRREGMIDFVDNELDPNSGTIRVRARFENPEELLTPGLFGRLRVPATEEYEAMLVPDAAVQSDQSRKIVLVVDGEGTVSPRIVELGPIYRGLRVIRSGLSPEDQVIIAGVQRARPGGKVAPQPAEIAFPDAQTQ